MNYRMLIRLLSIILLIEAGFLLIPEIVCLVYKESIVPFILTQLFLIIASIPGLIIKTKNTRIYAREGFVCVFFAWVFMSMFGAIPFVIDGSIPNYIDAVFETISGFTTTGATILTEIETLPRGILLWRSFTHWIGGMGVLVFVLAILPSNDGRAIFLMRAEVRGPTKGKLVPKLRTTARILYLIYLFITVAEAVALMICGFSLYDAFVTAFATTGTGGFAVKNASIAGFNNPAAEWVIAVFMTLCGINFNLFYFILIKKFKDIFKSEEFKVYFALLISSIVLIMINTYNLFSSFSEALRTVYFQVATIMSTAGFSTVDYNTWPEFSKAIMVLLTFIGACAGSTAGGLKVSRLLIIIKSYVREIRHVLKPKAVNVVRLDGEVVSEDTIKSSTNYFAIYISLLLIGTIIVSMDNFDFTTNFTAVLTCLNNVGPGLNIVGPAGNFASFSYLSKILLSFMMLVGRLEIYPVIILFSGITWKKR